MLDSVVFSFAAKRLCRTPSNVNEVNPTMIMTAISPPEVLEEPEFETVVSTIA
jgi:hypothetical protein